MVNELMGMVEMRSKAKGLAVLAGMALASLGTADAAQAAGWVGTWASAPSRGTGAAPGTRARVGFNNETIRQVARVSAGGTQLKVRLSNKFGTRGITFGSVTVARANASSNDPVAGTFKRITFRGGSASLSLSPGDQIVSDAVKFSAPSGTKIVVSMYMRGPTGPTTWHNVSKEPVSTSGGDQTTNTRRLNALDASYFITAVDAYRSESNIGTVVAFGDSITDGVFNKPGERYYYASREPWPDRLSRRILSANGRVRGTVNAGLAGNQLLSVNGPVLPNALDRLTSDVFARPNVRTLIVLLGTNDVILRADKGVSGYDLLNGARSLVARAHQAGMNVIGSTVPPIGAGTSSAIGRAREKTRKDFNALVRSSKPFDCLVDFDALLRNPSQTNKLNPIYDSGDHVHPSAAGYRKMGEAIPVGCIR